MRKEWVLLKEEREKAFKKRHLVDFERWGRGTKELPPLKVGQDVLVQNQVGPRANKWDHSGRVVEVLDHESYCVKIDGSGRVTKRRRHFLKAIRSFTYQDNGIKDSK